LLAVSLPAQAGRLLDIELIDKDSGEILPIYRQGGQAYVPGNPGVRYSVRLTNRGTERLLAVLSVDGINVVTGETAAPDQSGYVLEAYASAEIEGWRKSLADVARFYFTALPDSYAARTDRPDNVGVIGVAVFRAKAEAPVYLPQTLPARPESAAGAVRSESAADDSAYKARRQADRLGTGHGERQYSPTRYTDFERAGRQPNEILSLRYDSRANLVAQGVIRPPRPRPAEPRPFPGWFVPDPRG
jgi:hypothetical protein